MNEVLFDAIPDSAYPALNITEGSQSVAHIVNMLVEIMLCDRDVQWGWQ